MHSSAPCATSPGCVPCIALSTPIKVPVQLGEFDEPIPFNIRDEENDKALEYVAELCCRKGLVVSEAFGLHRAIMVLTLADKSPFVLGKVQHPNTATLFRVCLCSSTDRPIALV